MLLCEGEKARFGRHTFLMNTSQGLLFYYREIWEKKPKMVFFFFMLQEAWLCEEAAIWQNVLKYECRTGILSLHAARAEQLFTLGFWCGILLNFLWQFYSHFRLSCATAVTLLGTRWLLKFWICSLTMLDMTPTEKLYLLNCYKKKFGRGILLPFLSPASQKVLLWKQWNPKHECCILRLLLLVGVCRLCSPTNKVLYFLLYCLEFFAVFLVMAFCL